MCLDIAERQIGDVCDMCLLEFIAKRMLRIYSIFKQFVVEIKLNLQLCFVLIKMISCIFYIPVCNAVAFNA